jgi:tetratricopeptide (TPR) repeat protein
MGYSMDDTFLRELLATDDLTEKAAIVAEFVFNGLPKETALVARQCVILHWFDQFVVKALLQDTLLTESNAKEVYGQIISLPFIEKLAWGQAFQDLTREGLLKRYALSQPELLRSAARLAAPVYEAHEENEKIAAEALFCYIVAGDHRSSLRLLNKLLEQANNREDCQYIDSLLQLQDEAELLPFIQPFPHTEQYWMLRGLVHRVHGDIECAILDYSKAVAINPQCALAYVGRGTAYAEQYRYTEALAEYNYVIQLNPMVAQAYINRGIIFTRQGHYTEALEDFSFALQLNPNNTVVYLNKGALHVELRQYEEALAAYEQTIRLDPDFARVYYNKGFVLYNLKRYEEALVTYEQAIHLNPNYADAYYNKGNILYKIKRYWGALAAYEQTIRLDPKYMCAYYNKIFILDNLERYEEAHAAYKQAIHLDPDFVDAFNTKDFVLDNLNRYWETLATREYAAPFTPNHIDAHSKDSILQGLRRSTDTLRISEEFQQFELFDGKAVVL